MDGLDIAQEGGIIWPLLLLGPVFLGFAWYARRRLKKQTPPPSLEEKYRSKWGVFFQKEHDSQKRAAMLSLIVRLYLSERFSISLENATPMEARRIVEKQRWSKSIKEVVLGVFEETDMIRFAGKHADQEVFANLGRKLESIFALGGTE